VRRPSNADAQEEASLVKLMQLFMFIPDSEWWLLALRFQTFVEDCWQDYQGDRLAPLLRQVGSERVRWRPRDSSRTYQERVAEHLERMKKVKKGRPWL
jgi:glutathione S-transferase